MENHTKKAKIYEKPEFKSGSQLRVGKVLNVSPCQWRMNQGYVVFYEKLFGKIFEK